MTKKRMKSGVIRGVYAITPEIPDTAFLLEQVGAALNGGVKLFQYRNKAAPAALRRAQCDALLAAVRRFDGTLIVNDDYRLALDAGADGVHLGKDDGRVEDARAALGPRAIIGVSCYNSLDRAIALQSAGADYVAFGSFFPSVTKPDAVKAPLELLSLAAAQLDLPVVAIGGIDISNAGQLVDSGADSIAVLSSLFGEGEVETRARALTGMFNGQGVQIRQRG